MCTWQLCTHGLPDARIWLSIVGSKSRHQWHIKQRVCRHDRNRKDQRPTRSSMKYQDGLLILVLSLLTSCLCEFISWLLIYRTQRYRNLKAVIERTSKRMESFKEKTSVAASTTKKAANKRIGRFEQDLREANQTMSMAKFQASGAQLIDISGGWKRSWFKVREFLAASYRDWLTQ